MSSRGYFGYCSIVLFPVGGGWGLFDTGHFSDRHLLIENLRRIDIDPAAITHVVLSHLHFDHVLNLSLFVNASVVVAEAEIEYARNVSSGRIQDPSLPDFWAALLEDRTVQTVQETSELGDHILLNRMPGHTPGCLVMFYDGPSKIAVCGDVIKNAWEAVAGESTLVFGDPEQARQSIKRVLAEASVIIPGHDRPFRMHRDGIEFLTPLRWEVRGHVFPRPRDEVLLAINESRGLRGRE